MTKLFSAHLVWDHGILIVRLFAGWFIARHPADERISIPRMGVGLFDRSFLDALINKTATLAETRKKMIASSPLYFCRQLPKTQIHFGDKDDITPASQGEMLFNAMKAEGLENNITFYQYKNRTHFNIGDNNIDMDERINNFFQQLY